MHIVWDGYMLIYLTFVRCDSDVCLYVSVAGQDVSVRTALGLLCWQGSGQHVGGCGRLLW